jgi:DeoR/GlpR family transcriptional regulator of sugar metabolism
MQIAQTRQKIGPHTAIVKALREYGSMQPDFLAEVSGTTTEELTEYLSTLEEKGVVRREGDTIELAT